MQEILKVTQQSEECLNVLAGQTEHAAHKYAKTLQIPSTELDQLTKSRSKHAIADPPRQGISCSGMTQIWLWTRWSKRHINLKIFADMRQPSLISPLGRQTRAQKTARWENKLMNSRSKLRAWNLVEKVHPHPSQNLSFAGTVAMEDILPEIVGKTMLGMALHFDPNTSPKPPKTEKMRQILVI